MDKNKKLFFDHLINNYWENIQNKKSISDLMKNENWYEALLHFKNYAYERNLTGAVNKYKEIAESVLKSIKNKSKIDNKKELSIWEEFQKECKKRGIKPNKKVDPLKPSKNLKISLVKFNYEITKSKNLTIASWAYNMLKHNKLKEAHTRLKTVQGVGDKIASFYLRDVFWLGSNLDPSKYIKNIDNDYLLQPIDIWVERAVEAMGCTTSSDKHKQICISKFEKSISLPPGGANIAFWLLGSKYITDKNDYKIFIRSLHNPSKNDKTKVLKLANFYAKFGELLKQVISEK